MKDEDKLIEVMADLLAEVHEMRTEMGKSMGVNNNRLESLEKQQRKTNMELGEVRLSLMKVAPSLEKHADQEKRIKRLVKAVFNGH